MSSDLDAMMHSIQMRAEHPRSITPEHEHDIRILLAEVERLRTENARVAEMHAQAFRIGVAEQKETKRLRALLVEAGEALRVAETLIDILRFKYEQERKVAAALDAHRVETRIGAVLAKLPASEPTGRERDGMSDTAGLAARSESAKCQLSDLLDRSPEAS